MLSKRFKGSQYRALGRDLGKELPEFIEVDLSQAWYGTYLMVAFEGWGHLTLSLDCHGEAQCDSDSAQLHDESNVTLILDEFLHSWTWPTRASLGVKLDMKHGACIFSVNGVSSSPLECPTSGAAHVAFGEWRRKEGFPIDVAYRASPCQAVRADEVFSLASYPGGGVATHNADY